MNDYSAPEKKKLSGLFRAVIRISTLFFYVCSLFVFNAGAYSIIARKESRKTLVEYTNQNMPESCTVLLDGTKVGQSSVVLASIDPTRELNSPWALYQRPGYGQVSVGDEYDSCHYLITELSDTHKKVKLQFWVGGGDVKQIHVYEIDNNRVTPVSYNSRAEYFGWMFSALPFGFLITFLFVAAFELLIVRRFFLKKG